MKESVMKYISALYILLLLTGCGSSSQPETDPSLREGLIDQNTLPITQGSWYRPSLDTSWQWQLSGTLNTSYAVELFDIDLFDTVQVVIDSLHAQGKKVICYFSAGSYENWREDKDSFDSSLLGNNLDGWNGEKWLNISSPLLRPIMRGRLDLAVAKGCDGVEPDNVDGYTNNTGFALSARDHLSYNKFLANEAHRRGLSVGLKNDIDQIYELEPYFDFAVNEQCHQYNECNTLTPFITKAKPVFNAEYKAAYVNNTNSKSDIMCSQAAALQFQTLVLPLNLDDTFRIECN